MKISIGKTFTRSQVLDMGSDTGTNCVCDANSKKRQRQKVVVLMANDKRRKLNVGDTVRLKGRKKTAKVRALLNDITGGVMLTDYLDDFRCWNADDLRIVRRARHLMTNHPKFTESHDSEARKSGSRTSTGSRKPCKPFLAIQDGMRGKQEMYTILRCPYCKVDHKGIVLLTDLPEKCPIRRAARISDKTSKAKR